MPPGYPGAPAYYPSPGDYERTRQVDRTKTAILLILVGTLLSWVPFLIDGIGYLLIFIGLILLALGRKAFGEHHSRNAILSIVLLVLGIGVIFGSALPLGVAVGLAQISGIVPSSADLTSDFQILLVGEIIGAVAFGLMSVLATYALQKQEGRLLLFAGFGASVALSVAIYILVAPLVQSAILEGFRGGTFDPAAIVRLEGLASTYGLLNAIPSLLFAAGEYLAWSRINRGEVPSPSEGSAVPTPMSVSPSTPPPLAPPPSGPAPPINPP